MSEANEVAVQTKTDTAFHFLFKSRYEECHGNFYGSHNSIIGSLEEFSIDFNEQDAIRKKFDKLYYECKGIYYDLLRSNPTNYV